MRRGPVTTAVLLMVFAVSCRGERGSGDADAPSEDAWAEAYAAAEEESPAAAAEMPKLAYDLHMLQGKKVRHGCRLLHTL